MVLNVLRLCIRKKRTRTVVNMSSEDGSISINRSGQHGEQSGMQLAYSCSKAALNMRAPSQMLLIVQFEGLISLCSRFPLALALPASARAKTLSTCTKEHQLGYPVHHLVSPAYRLYYV